MTEDEKELRFLAQDIVLFLRLASTHFSTKQDLLVIEHLKDLAARYGAGQDIRKAEENAT